MAKVEKSTGKRFGDQERPLLVSVRSGARDSMPGMMDTILNLGMNDEVVEIVAKKTKNKRFAWDSYRRFLQMYGDVVMGVQKRPGEDHEPFEAVIERLKDERYGKHDFPDVRLTVADLKELVQRFKALINERTGKSFPQDPNEQLWGAIGAVFGSWMNDRAIVYRRKYGIPHEWGTAVNVQTMVFGNMGDTSATGVAFTRDPATGEKVFYGEYLINAQGEDVVAGVRTPHPIADLAKEMPAAHKELMNVRSTLEQHFKDMQDLEFTVEENRLYILQTRNGKRTGHAAVRIAVDMVGEKLITKKDAVRRVPADSLSHLLAPVFDREAVRNAKKIGTGLAAGPGAACGHVVFSAEEAVARADRGEKVVLARIETSPEDLRGMIAAEGILTARGGVSSHAALVARQMGKVCVCGATGIQIDYHKGTLSANGTTLNRGDYISIDGTAGEVFAGEVATAPSEIIQVLVDRSLDPKKSVTYQEYAKLMKWADEFRTPRRARKCRHARAGQKRCRVRRGRNRALPHGAHVFRRRPDRRHAGDDSRRHKGRARASTGETAPLSARRFYRHLYCAKWFACHDPLSRSAAARVSARRSRAAKRTGEQARRARGTNFAPRARVARI